MKNDNKEMSVAEAVAHTFPLEVLQEAVRLRLKISGKSETKKIDPFDTPFDDIRGDFLSRARGK
ncbi:MAG: hypothetical protein GY915_02565 [bacterium]|nr:hypothetical protein [bacterium]